MERHKGMKMNKIIILDCGSAETCKNDLSQIKLMVKTIAHLQKQTDKTIIIKWQLFEYLPGLLSLSHEAFGFAYKLAKEYGLQTTASVFDYPSSKFLNTFEVSFVKIACRPNCYHLIKLHSQRVFVSIDSPLTYKILAEDFKPKKLDFLCCVPEYPANENMYRSLFYGNLSSGISDHTTGFNLYKLYQPDFYEKHFYVTGQTGPDVESFACNEETIKEIL